MAAEDSKPKKRKGASDAAPKPKKQKKLDDAAATAPRKSNRTSKAVVQVTALPAAKVEDALSKAESVLEKKQKRKSKADPDDGYTSVASVMKVTEKPKKAKKGQEPVVDAAVEVAAQLPSVKAKKGNKVKQPQVASSDIEAEVVVRVEEVPAAVEVKKSKKSKGKEDALVEGLVEPVEETVTEEEEDLDDQTAALLAGFESDRDESDLEKDDELTEENHPPKLTKKQRKALENVRKDSEPGVVYLGRIPHGFFEPQMKKYFAQFGDIRRLRLSRNKKTGASKHYAFIEFRHGEVADIVAQAMNNYLMFGHILQCRVIPSEQVHEELFKGSNERFKVDPRNKKAGNAMARGAERPVWEKRVEKENRNRLNKIKALQDEFDYNLTAPAVKTVDSVPKKVLSVEHEAEQQLLDEAPLADVTEVVQITESTPDQLSVTETVKIKKTKKEAKSKPAPETESNGVPEVERSTAARIKREKKRKSDVAVEDVDESAFVPKTKKLKDGTDAAEGHVVVEKKRTKASDHDGATPKKVKKSKA